MPKRGSAQLLLLSFRSRPRLGWPVGCIAAALAIGALLHIGGQFSGARAALADLFRQSAWEHALAGLPEQTPWPWADGAGGTNGTVSQLGLSAAVTKEGATGESEGSAIRPVLRAAQDPHLPPAEFGELDIDDRITVTTADGVSQACRATGLKVIDPHLADALSGNAEAESALAACLPLVVPATKAEPPSPEPGLEHKL